MMELVVTAGALRCAKLQSNRPTPTNQHPTFYRPDAFSCHPTNIQNTEGKKYHIPWTCSLQAHLGILQPCL